MTNIDEERVAFEKWVVDQPMWSIDPIAKRLDGQYASIATNHAWIAWLARAKAGSGVDDSYVARMTEEVAKLLSGAPFPSARSYAKAREVVALVTAPPKEGGE